MTDYRGTVLSGEFKYVNLDGDLISTGLNYIPNPTIFGRFEIKFRLDATLYTEGITCIEAYLYHKDTMIGNGTIWSYKPTNNQFIDPVEVTTFVWLKDDFSTSFISSAEAKEIKVKIKEYVTNQDVETVEYYLTGGCTVKPFNNSMFLYTNPSDDGKVPVLMYAYRNGKWEICEVKGVLSALTDETGESIYNINNEQLYTLENHN